MTLRQWRRTKVFALRMVRVATSPRWQPKLKELVLRAIDRFEGNGSHLVFVDWDNSKLANGASRNSYGYSPELLCDEVSRFLDDMAQEGELPWNKHEGGSRDDGLAVKVACCIRAGADVGSAPSAGVLGWTAGDIRRMWKGRKVPAWVRRYFKDEFDNIPDANPVWL